MQKRRNGKRAELNNKDFSLQAQSGHKFRFLLAQPAFSLALVFKLMHFILIVLLICTYMYKYYLKFHIDLPKETQLNERQSQINREFFLFWNLKANKTNKKQNKKSKKLFKN